MTPLRSFLERPSRPAGALGYHATQGFLFAVACSPELVSPSEWLSIVLGEEPEFDAEADANAVLDGLMTLYNAINQTILERAPRLPDDCPLALDPLANLGPDSPVGQWSIGFHAGHSWLVETWDEFLPEGVEPELDGEMGAVLMTLTFFSSRDLALAYASDAPERSFSEMAGLVHRLFGQAMESYAFIGRSLGQAVATMPIRQGVTVGRNDPCPCGSGRKYKKCCLGKPPH